MSTSTSTNNLRFATGVPPSGWLDTCQDIESKARALCLWEMTMSLIKNEPFLSRDPKRYLAMISDHRRAFTSLLQTVDLPDVPETEYLHAKLSNLNIPTFRPSGFRSLRFPSKEDRKDRRALARPLADVLKQDDQLKAHLERLKLISRELAEIETSRTLITKYRHRRR